MPLVRRDVRGVDLSRPPRRHQRSDRVIALYVDTFGGSLEFDDVAHLFDVLAEALTWFAQHLAEQLAVSQLGVEL